jgi:hypothetical protein
MSRSRRRIKDVRRRPRNSTARDPGHVIHHRKRSKIRNTITSVRLRLQNWFGEILHRKSPRPFTDQRILIPVQYFCYPIFILSTPYDAEPSPSATFKIKTTRRGLGEQTRNNRLTLLTQPLHAKPNNIARPQIHRRLLSQANSRRRARRNNISRLETHKPAQIAN